MRLNKTKSFGGAILGLLMFFGIIVMSGTTAQAQYWPWSNQDQNRRQREYQRQQQEREKQLQKERQRQARQGGWYDQYGNYHTGSYNQNTYNRGRNYDGYGNNGGSYELRQTALNAGYNEGMKAGRDDRRSGRYNPTGHGAYQDASKDYNSRMGDRYAYQSYFRAAFQNGYADGYRY